MRLTLAGILAVAALFAGAGGATAQADVIVIPVDTVVRGVPVGSLTELASAPVAPELVGATCTGDAVGRNNETSVHPGNDLIVTTGSSSAVLHDVEREPGVVTETVGALTLGEVITVSAGSLETFGLPLRVGRYLDARDAAGAPGAVVVSETLAARLWPGESPVGRRIRFGSGDGEAGWRTVVGVVGPVEHYNVHIGPIPLLYVPLAQHPDRRLSVALRTAALRALGVTGT